jgi:hypothetical protein
VRSSHLLCDPVSTRALASAPARSRAPQAVRPSDSSPRLAPFPFCQISNHCWKTGGGPLIRFHFRLTFTSTRLAILMKGMLLFIP